ncbi:MAG: CPBP family intramembrane glutamic endopeptidase [Anaerolineae bacterium]
MRPVIILSLTLVLVSNGLGWLISATGIDRQSAYFTWAVVLLLAALWWARGSAHLTWSDIGLAGEGGKRSAAIGLLCGIGLAIPLFVFMLFAPLLAGPVHYGEIQSLDALALLWRVGVELTIATALTEEILFRGILQALFERVWTTTRALVSTNVVFALWHLWANALSLQQNKVVIPFLSADASQALGYLGSLVAVGMGGLLLSILRERTRHLAGSVIAHWAAVAAMTLMIYMR